MKQSWTLGLQAFKVASQHSVEMLRFHVLNPIARGVDPDDCLAFVQEHLRKAKELVEDFEDIANTFGRRARERQLQLTSNRNQQLTLNQSQQLAFRPSPTSFAPQSLSQASAASFYAANNNAVNVNTYAPASASRPPATIFNAQPQNVNTYIPASASFPTVPAFNAQPQSPSNEVNHSHDTQHYQDDGRRDDVQNLLVLSEVDIPPSQRKQTPKQMSCDLTEHQRIGLTWLLQQERDPKKKGGLLADTMGLGKTVQAMALILAHPSTDPKHKTTLIVAPLALLRQWEQEILTKVKPRYKLNTLVFHGEVAKYMSVSELLKHDVVLCTYGKLQTEHKNKYEHKKPEKLKILADKAIFYRVILDEAHNIRNQTTYCSKAAAEIQSKYRLCMTGTPFMNRAEEIFPLIRFLNIPPYNKWDRFSEDIVRPLRKWDGNEKEHGMIKLQALFRSFTLRRTKDSRLNGKPIIELPPRTDKPSFVEFNDEQRAFYQALEVQQQLKFNKYLKNGAVMKNYIHILILLLRLRQACDHPFLLKNLGIPDGTKLDEKQMIKLACQLPSDVVQKLKRQESFECPLCSDATDNPVIVYPCGHHVCSSCFTGSVKVVETEDFSNGGADDETISRKKSVVSCPGEDCQHAITPTNIVCYNFLADVPDSGSESDDDNINKHSFKTPRRDDEDADRHGNLRGFVVNDEAAYDEDSSDDEESDDDSQDGEGDAESQEADGDGRMTHIGGFGPSQTDGAYDDLNANRRLQTPKRKPSASALGGHSGKKSRASAGSPSGKNKGKGQKKKTKMITMADQRQAAQRSAIAMSRYKARLREEWISSAKIDAIMDILEQIRPKKEKTLVFSLWTSFLDLVEIPVERARIKFTRYDGSMTPGAREAAVKSFMEDPSVRVMLVSLTAGNAGLNLTAASQVIVTEPFWNPYVEEQAIDRAHRFGQEKPVTVHRLLIEGTVEDRIVQLQEKKKMLVDAALSERGAANISRLNVAELRNLFGLSGEFGGEYPPA
ncbi:hypothetical protein INS49_015362 [Diaporthe citri]|uniref:uncharacterized protein n=1 Tax=Diaporthe citri TaxID=83186 RepID=UPI001C7FC7EA|nr:uncharacterized protein INS49_015362 [Diaporthe citri]KAG6355977.1 hypothetical protein INS49_015362 [Diaporthe citri]